MLASFIVPPEAAAASFLRYSTALPPLKCILAPLSLRVVLALVRDLHSATGTPTAQWLIDP